MSSTRNRQTLCGTVPAAMLCFAMGLMMGVVSSEGLAQSTAPTEHKGVTVTAIGELPATSIEKQIGLTGYVLRLRVVTVEPGGQIARHSHAERPGLVYMLSGTWIEGRPGGETEYRAGEPVSIIEDEATDHWVWNRAEEPGTALVCDMVPPS